ncbi:MAG TPA: DUF1016 N-terminal domain-containing protein [Myxococcota bacterium]|nr:DUF1016 N-terminal domain-containing protein [Myxococcota bacterium]
MTAITLNISDYKKLKTDLADLLEKGRQQAQEALAEVANHTYWKVGRRLQLATDGAGRTESAELFRRLSSDLGLGQSTLYHTLQFFRLYPNGLPRSPAVAKLPWGKQVALLSVPDQAERLYYVGQALEQGWSRSRLRRAIRSGSYRSLPALLSGAGSELARPDSRLHTYLGVVERVVDGDTLDVRIDLGFMVWKSERLRLRGIDAPELNTPAGKKARSFVERELGQCKFVVFHTYKTDLYARYIADLLYDPALEDENAVFEKGHFLNQKLLDNGLALPLPG